MNMLTVYILRMFRNVYWKTKMPVKKITEVQMRE